MRRVQDPQSRSSFRAIYRLLISLLFIAWAQGTFSGVGIPGWGSYQVRILNLAAINAVLALSLNLINGFTGQFSLGHAGFMAVGAYTTALLTMNPAVKKSVFFMVPLIEPLDRIQTSFAVALLTGGLLAGVFSLAVGVPALRLRGDYLAIATLGFSEIIRLVIQNARRITNGALGLKDIPANTNLWWTFGTLAVTFVLLRRLVDSTYGRVFKSIRENEVAAQAMGIDLFRHKIIAFFISSFLAGVGGGLMAGLLTTIDPVLFKFPLTFQILLMVVLGGMGSLSGSVVSAFLVTWLMEFLRFVEEPHYFGHITIPGIPGLRMVIFSLALVVVVIWYPRGLLGEAEVTFDDLLGMFNKTLSRIRRGKRPQPGGTGI